MSRDVARRWCPCRASRCASCPRARSARAGRAAAGRAPSRRRARASVSAVDRPARCRPGRRPSTGLPSNGRRRGSPRLPRSWPPAAMSRLAADQHEADLALAGRRATRLAGGSFARVEADIGPAGALRRDVDAPGPALEGVGGVRHRQSRVMIRRPPATPPIRRGEAGRHVGDGCLVVDPAGEPVLARRRRRWCGRRRSP